MAVGAGPRAWLFGSRGACARRPRAVPGLPRWATGAL